MRHLTGAELGGFSARGSGLRLVRMIEGFTVIQALEAEINQLIAKEDRHLMRYDPSLITSQCITPGLHNKDEGCSCGDKENSY